MNDAIRTCPRDAATLVPVEVEGVRLDSCPTCGGLWFDLGELREAEAHVDGNLAWLDFTLWRDEEQFQLTRTPLACPRSECGGHLGSLIYHDTGVLVHVCTACHGTWLDHGDLELIVARLQRELNELETSAIASASLAEAAQLATHPGRLAAEWKDLMGLLGLLRQRLVTSNRGLVARLVQAARDTPFG